MLSRAFRIVRLAPTKTRKHYFIALSRQASTQRNLLNLNSFFPPRWRRPRSRLSPANPRSLYRGVQGILRSLIMMTTAMMMVLIMMADNDTILRADIVHWSWYLTVILRSYCLLNQLTSDHPSTLTKMNIVEAIVSSTVIVINVRWTCGIKANNRVNYVVKSQKLPNFVKISFQRTHFTFLDSVYEIGITKIFRIRIAQFWCHKGLRYQP